MRLFVSIATSYTLLLNLISCTNVSSGNAIGIADTIQYKYKTAHSIQDNKEIKDSTLLFRSSITYPEFDKKQHAILADSINTFIRQTSFSSHQTAEEATKAFVSESIKQTAGEEGATMQGWENMDSITVIANQPTFISLRRMHFEYTGGAHGNPSVTYASFNTTNGKHLKFDDILATGKLNALKSINIKQLKALRNLEEQYLLEASGLFISGDDLPLPSTFALTTKGLLISYDYYEIACYADGVTTYTIPFSKLKGILKSEYIISE